MQGPDDEFRRYIATQIADIASESGLEGLLAQILVRAFDDVNYSEATLENLDAVFAELAHAQAWLSLASYCLNAFYSPGAPRGDVAGWSSGAAENLCRLADMMQNSVRITAPILGSDEISVGTAFPFGASVSLSWPALP
jgi:hypothetical protein